MTDYKGPNAFSGGRFKPAKEPKIISPYQRAPDSVVRQTDGPAFNNRFPKSRYQGGGQSGLRPVLEVAGGGGGGYVAKAVHFDGSAWLSIDSLTAFDSSVFSMSFWTLRTVTDITQEGQLFTTDPDGNYGPTGSIGLPPSFSSIFFQIDGNAQPRSTRVRSANEITQDVWTHCLFSIDTNFGAGLKPVKMYVNDINDVGTFVDTNNAFVMLFSALKFIFGGDGTGGGAVLGSYADVWIGPGVTLLDGDGNIPDATRRLFTTAGNKPVDPSGFPSGAILFSGDDVTFGTNQGTGGAFTTTGALTNAATSPSD